MRPILLAALDRFVGDEPGVAAASHAGRGRAPASDIRLVLILHAHRLSLERRSAGGAEVKNELMAVVEKAAAVDRLVVPDCQVVLETGPDAGQSLFDGDR